MLERPIFAFAREADGAHEQAEPVFLGSEHGLNGGAAQTWLAALFLSSKSDSCARHGKAPDEAVSAIDRDMIFVTEYWNGGHHPRVNHIGNNRARFFEASLCFIPEVSLGTRDPLCDIFDGLGIRIIRRVNEGGV
jgi:hypothetical protein